MLSIIRVIIMDSQQKKLEKVSVPVFSPLSRQINVYMYIRRDRVKPSSTTPQHRLRTVKRGTRCEEQVFEKENMWDILRNQAKTRNFQNSDFDTGARVLTGSNISRPQFRIASLIFCNTGRMRKSWFWENAFSSFTFGLENSEKLLKFLKFGLLWYCIMVFQWN